MKTKFLIPLLAFLILSCNSADKFNPENDGTLTEKETLEKTYDLATWVKVNNDKLINYSREELSQYSPPAQKEILRSFSSKKRKNIW